MTDQVSPGNRAPNLDLAGYPSFLSGSVELGEFVCLGLEFFCPRRLGFIGSAKYGVTRSNIVFFVW